MKEDKEDSAQENAEDILDIFAEGYVMDATPKQIENDTIVPSTSRRTDSFANRGNNTISESKVRRDAEKEAAKTPHEDTMVTGDRLNILKSNLRKEQQGEFIYGLYEKGLPLLQEQIDLLLELGLVTEEEITGIKKIKEEEEDATPFDQRSNNKDDFSNGRKIGVYEHCGEEIDIKDWKAKSTIEHDPQFVKFIDSINKNGFQKKIYFKPLADYIKQAHNWLSEKDYIQNYKTFDEKWEYFERESKRCEDNTLYFLEKYLYLKEADMEDASSMKYYAKPAHEVMLFLADTGYSMMIGKARQIAATTTFLGFGLKKLVFTKNFFLKFVTMDVDTAQEIMDDKLKYPLNEMPSFIRPHVDGNSKDGLIFGRKIPGKKGLIGGANSKFHVVAPSVSAINAGAPPLVFVDEAGYIKMLGKMLREARPTMFRQNQRTGKLEMVRQCIVWSTGGVDEGKNKVKTKSFEEEVGHALEKWEEGSYSYGFVPIFFDWTTRPGITQSHYDNEKRNYSSGAESEREQRMNQFRLTYPECWEDMFLSEQTLLLPISQIQENENRINKAPVEFKPQPGYFEPIVDTTVKGGRGYSHDFGGKITGARFIPVDYDDDTASAFIFLPPDRGWKNRYYKGTDPIMHDTGTSNMASAIIDVKLNTISAIVDCRHEDHKATFLQSFLLGLYYNIDGHSRGIPELIESNIGIAYTDYVDSLGYYNTLVYKDELPDAFRGGGQTIGIDNKGRRSEFIISRMREMLLLYSKNIFFLKVFQQLRTFGCTMTASGNMVWAVSDKRRYKDDVLYAIVFAYICSICYADREFKKVSLSGRGKTRITYELQRGSDGMLTRVPVSKKGR